jgi:hypothetical protein
MWFELRAFTGHRYMNIGAHSGVAINDNTPELMVAQEIAA